MGADEVAQLAGLVSIVLLPGSLPNYQEQLNVEMITELDGDHLTSSAPVARTEWQARCSVLFACKGSLYHSLPVDVYDIDRDALTFPGGTAVVAHPPCRAWASLRHCAKPREGEKDLAPWAVEQVRRWGGVLEHPLNSILWRTLGLPEGVRDRDEYGGFTLKVDQFWWGHRARKRTRLYICGIEPRDVPAYPLKLGEAPCTVGLWSGRDKENCRPSISKKEFELTPRGFAEWLVDLALRADRARSTAA